jgi:hypothetical protein
MPPITARARPVAELAFDAVLARADELARRWAIALLVDRPLDRMADVPFEQMAGEAPALCAQAVRAVASDAELDRLTGWGQRTGREASAAGRRLASIVGAQDVGELVAAVEALRGVLWETMLAELGPDPEGGLSLGLGRAPERQLADLADRLASVCAGIVAVAATTFTGEHGSAAGDRAGASGDDEVARRTGAGSAGGHGHAPGAGAGAVIVDERSESSVPADRLVSASRLAPRAVGREPGSERPLSWDESPPVPPRACADEIEIRDERREQGAVAWTRSIGRQLERFERDGMPFAALLVELLHGGRPFGEEQPAQTPASLNGAVEDALAAELRSACGSVTQERPGRYWVLVPQTDRSGAERLAERLIGAARSAGLRRGYSLEVAIGTAVCPDDGREAAALAAHADVGLYAARSTARAAGARPAGSMDEPSQA